MGGKYNWNQVVYADIQSKGSAIIPEIEQEYTVKLWCASSLFSLMSAQHPVPHKVKFYLILMNSEHKEGYKKGDTINNIPINAH